MQAVKYKIFSLAAFSPAVFKYSKLWERWKMSYFLDLLKN